MFGDLVGIMKQWSIKCKKLYFANKLQYKGVQDVVPGFKNVVLILKISACVPPLVLTSVVKCS